MKKLLIKLLILLITLGMAGSVYAAAPSRSFDYVAGEIIDPDEVTRNEDNIFSYLQTGVDTYTNSSITSAHITDGTITSADILDGTIASADILDGTIVNADINSSAAIAFTKMSLSDDITFTGDNTFAGTTIADLGTVTTADINGGTIDGVTIGATSAPTVTDLGTVTTADIDGGTLDGVQIGGTTATGELIVNDSSDYADGLGSQGTSGQFLQSAGAGANPTFAMPTGMSNVIFSWSGCEVLSTSGNEHGFYTGDTLTPTVGASEPLSYAFFMVTAETYRTFLTFQFTKIAGISTITIHARLWSKTTSATEEAILNVDIGGASNTVKSVTSDSPSWVTTADIDVSGLNDDTTYNGICQLKNEDTSTADNSYCSAVILIGS